MHGVAAKKDAPAQKAADQKESGDRTPRADRNAGDKSTDQGKKTAEPGNELYTYEQPKAEEQSYVWGMIKMIIVLGLMVGGFYYFFRFVSRRTGGPLGTNIAQVLSLIPLGQNKFIQIIDLAGKVLVLGVTDHAINLIMEIKDKDEIDRIRLAGSKAAVAQPGGFQDFLTRQVGRLLRRRDAARRDFRQYIHRPEEADVDRLDYLSMQKERLKKLNGMDNE